jgi:hypothetical protein
MTEYNTCPRCAASGCGACDDYPRCQEEPVKARVAEGPHGWQNVDYIVTRDGGFMQLMPFDWDYGALREQLAKATPEERIEAAQRYISARYDEAVIRGVERVTGEIYDPETDTWALPPERE